MAVIAGLQVHQKRQEEAQMGSAMVQKAVD